MGHSNTTRPPELRLFSGAIVDLFAGGGGASVGIERATGRSPDVAINHDRDAISMHKVNHPGTKHYIENVWRVDPRKALKATGKEYVELMWLSPDCKHFSKAKGSKPRRDKKIRSLATVAIYWIKALGPKRRPRVIILENVEEFQKWGPLLADGSPCPAREGLSFRRYVKQLQNLGYNVDFRELVAADYGAPTSRKRLFMVARCDGKAIVWPEASHDQSGRRGLPKWRSAAECIDFTLACPSIFERKKELAENTQRRIARGIEKFVKKDPFIVQTRHQGEGRAYSIDDPLRTVTSAHRGEMALVHPFIAGVGGRRGQSNELSVESAMPTVTSKGDAALVAPVIAQYNGAKRDESRCHDIRNPVGTVTGDPRFALVAPVIVGAGGSEYAAKPVSAEAPMGTLTAENHRAVVVARIGQTGGNGDHVRGVDAPLSTVTSKAEHLMVDAKLERVQLACNCGAVAVLESIEQACPSCGQHQGGHATYLAPFGVKFRHDSEGFDLTSPLPTVTAGGFIKRPGGDAHALGLCVPFLKPRYGEREGQDPRSRSIEAPMPTVVPTANGGDLVATFLAKHNAGHEATGQRLDTPTDTVTATDSKALVASSLIKLKGTCRDGQSLTVPLATVAAQGNHHAEVRAFLMKYHRDGGQHGSLRLPMPTVLANDSLALVMVEGQPHVIVDIGMRMLQPRELFKSHDFPKDYIIERNHEGKPTTKEAQVRMVGNSVPPPMADAIIRANFGTQLAQLDLLAVAS